MVDKLFICCFLNFQTLEDKERKQSSVREQLRREQRFLQRRLDQLTDGQYRVRQERSISECSTSTNSTTSSNSETGKSVTRSWLKQACSILTDRDPILFYLPSSLEAVSINIPLKTLKVIITQDFFGHFPVHFLHAGWYL